MYGNRASRSPSAEINKTVSQFKTVGGEIGAGPRGALSEAGLKKQGDGGSCLPGIDLLVLRLDHCVGHCEMVVWCAIARREARSRDDSSIKGCRRLEKSRETEDREGRRKAMGRAWCVEEKLQRLVGLSDVL